jgi:hypothetical protein
MQAHPRFLRSGKAFKRLRQETTSPASRSANTKCAVRRSAKTELLNQSKANKVERERSSSKEEAGDKRERRSRTCARGWHAPGSATSPRALGAARPRASTKQTPRENLAHRSCATPAQGAQVVCAPGLPRPLAARALIHTQPRPRKPHRAPARPKCCSRKSEADHWCHLTPGATRLP